MNEVQKENHRQAPFVTSLDNYGSLVGILIYLIVVAGNENHFLLGVFF